MENERKKRKMEKEQDGAEEEKIDKFFALLRSTKEVRDRLRFNVAKEMEKQEEKPVPASAAGWSPAFQVEDFMEESMKVKMQAGPSKAEQEQKEAQGEENKEKGQGSGLDLNLSL